MNRENIWHPKISIITVVFNGEKTLEQTILSVVNQSYQNIEYIIIDGGSTDGTIDIIKKYEDEITYWVSETDRGIYDAMNKGIEQSNGEFIQFLGADDSLVNNSIIDKVSKYLSFKTYILSAPIWCLDDKNRIQKLYDNNLSEDDILNGMMLPHSGMFVKRKLLLKYRYNLDFKIISDYEFLLKCILSKVRIDYINEPVVYFSNSGISSQQIHLLNKEHIVLFEKYHINRNHLMQFQKKSKINKITLLFRYTLKKILVLLNLWVFFQMKRGWIKHKCKNQQCRWCQSINERNYFS